MPEDRIADGPHQHERRRGRLDRGIGRPRYPGARYSIHINNSNPVLDAGSPEPRGRERGGVADRGGRHGLRAMKAEPALKQANRPVGRRPAFPGAVVAVRLAPSHMKPGIIPPWASLPGASAMNNAYAERRFAYRPRSRGRLSPVMPACTRIARDNGWSFSKRRSASMKSRPDRPGGAAEACATASVASRISSPSLRRSIRRRPS